MGAKGLRCPRVSYWICWRVSSTSGWPSPMMVRITVCQPTRRSQATAVTVSSAGPRRIAAHRRICSEVFDQVSFGRTGERDPLGPPRMLANRTQSCLAKPDTGQIDSVTE